MKEKYLKKIALLAIFGLMAVCHHAVGQIHGSDNNVLEADRYKIGYEGAASAFMQSLYYNSDQVGIGFYKTSGRALLFSILESGNVGVGVANPTEKLDVGGNVKATGDIYSLTGHVYSGSGNVFSAFGNVYTTSGNIYTTSGKVGIGQAVGTEKLEVTGNIKSTGNLYSSGSGSIYTSSGSIYTSTGNIYTGGKVGIGNSTAPGATSETLEVTGNIKSTGNLYSSGSGSIYTSTGNIYTTSGKVGIGQAVGTEKLEVTGNIKATGSISAASLSVTSGISTGTSHLSTTSGNIFSSSTGNIYTTSGNIYTTSGKVGIGQAPGTENLEVTGNIKSTGNLYSSGSGNIYTSSGNIYTTSGKVGIGQAVGTEKLEVTGNIKATGTITAGTITATAGISAGSSSLSTSTGNIYTTDGNMYTTSGKVGIGQVVGTEKLEVTGNIKATGSISAASLSVTSGLSTGASSLSTTTGNIYTASGNIYTTNGKVGIGQAPGTENLEVTGNIKATGNVTAASIDAQSIHINGVSLVANGSGPFTESNHLLSYDGSLSMGGNISASGTITGAGFSTSSGNIYTTSGKVGIGQAPGTEKLEVTGNIKATGNMTVTSLDAQSISLNGKGVVSSPFTETFSSRDGVTSSLLTYDGALTVARGLVTNGSVLVTGDYLATSAGNIHTTSGNIFTQNGKIGVGVEPSQTSEKLEVAGNIKATGTIAAQNITINGQQVTSSPFTESNNTLSYGGNLSVDGLVSESLSTGSIAAGSIDAPTISINGEKIVPSPFIESNNTLSYDGSINTSGNIYTAVDGKIGIGVTPNANSEELEVAGDIKVTGKTTNTLDASGVSHEVTLAGDIFTTGGNIYTTEAGKIGIGKRPTTSSEALEVIGNVKATGDISTTGTITAGTITSTAGISTGTSNLSTTSGSIYTTSGKFGIGVTPSSTSQALEVNGNIKATGTIDAQSIIVNGQSLVSMASPFGSSGTTLTYAGSIAVGEVVKAKTLKSRSLEFTNASNDVRVGNNAGNDSTYNFRDNYNVFLGYNAGANMDAPIGAFDGAARSVFVVNNQASASNPLMFGYFATIGDHSSNSSSATAPAQLGINTTELLDSVALTVRGGIAITTHDWTASSTAALNIKDLFGDFSLFAQNGIISPSYYIGHQCMWDEDPAGCPDSWGDFVFEADYKLTPLWEIEKFVSANKHLPGIPSASDISGKGYELHGMNKNFIVKIEELTLYAIEQEKKIEEQQQEIEKLKMMVKNYGDLAAEIQQLKFIVENKR